MPDNAISPPCVATGRKPLRSRDRRFPRLALLVALFVAGFAGGAGISGRLAAQVPGARLPVIPIKIIDGSPYVKAELRHGEVKFPIHLRLDIGRPQGISLHVRTARSLKLQRGDLEVEATFGDFAVTQDVTVSNAGNLTYLTAEHATALEEIPVSGIIGTQGFGAVRLRLDYAAKTLTILPKKVVTESSAAPSAAGTGDDSGPEPPLRLPVKMERGAMRLDLAIGAETIPAAISTMEADTWIATATAHRLGKPGGDVGEVLYGTVDVGDHVAFRPGDAPSDFPGSPQALLGSNFFNHFRVTFDPHGGAIELERVREPKFPHADQRCFVAMAASDAKALETFLTKNKGHRLAMEAGRTLLSVRIHESPLVKKHLESAVRLYVESTPKKRRSRSLLDFLKKMAQERKDVYDLVRAKALELSMKHARHDEDPDSVHRTRSELGAVLLEEGQLKEAYRHLLSAAFGLPRDGLINLRLGDLYAKKGQDARAWSRYLMAAITPEAGPQGMDGLKRLADKKGTKTPYDADEMERLLEGRIPAFEPASEYRPNERQKASGRVVVAELFTGAHCKPCAAADLAFDGCYVHFGGGEVVVLEHHVPIPAAEPLVCPASMQRARAIGVRSSPTVLLDGVSSVRGVGGNPGKASASFRRLRQAIERRLEQPTPWRLALDGRVADGEVAVTATIDGPAVEGVRLVLYLCERTMLFPGGNRIVLHRWVTRYDLTRGGVEIAARDGKRTIERRAMLEAVMDEVDEYLDAIEDKSNQAFPMRATEVAPKQVAVVGMLVDSNGAILQGARWQATPWERE